jgi:hypothetical protein
MIAIYILGIHLEYNIVFDRFINIYWAKVTINAVI